MPRRITSANVTVEGVLKKRAFAAVGKKDYYAAGSNTSAALSNIAKKILKDNPHVTNIIVDGMSFRVGSLVA